MRGRKIRVKFLGDRYIIVERIVDTVAWSHVPGSTCGTEGTTRGKLLGMLRPFSRSLCPLFPRLFSICCRSVSAAERSSAPMINRAKVLPQTQPASANYALIYFTIRYNEAFDALSAAPFS